MNIQAETGHHAVCIGTNRVSVQAREGRKTKALLSEITFNVTQGEFVAIIGASGCGKSTLIRTVAGVQEPTEGLVLLGGYPVGEIQAHFPLAISYLPQFGAFHSSLSVGENLSNAAELRLPGNVSSATKRNWMQHIIDLSGLGELLPQRYHTLSGGQMRRMALAEALIGDPAFLFLDELTSGLDAYSDHEIMLWLRELAHNLGKTVVLVTHATYHLHYCDSILFLHEGQLIQHGTYEELLESHGVSSITELFGSYQTGQVVQRREEARHRGNEEDEVLRIEPQPIKTARPPGGVRQFPTLLRRQARLFWRDRGQLWLHVALIVTFPGLVAVFAMHGLPQVRNLTLSLESNILRTLQEQLFYLKESFRAASVISGLAMFQVVLLTLIGANNGAREIAKEEEVLKKELRAGLSPTAYVSTKFLQIAGLCLIQAFWMAWFVKTIHSHPIESDIQVAHCQYVIKLVRAKSEAKSSHIISSLCKLFIINGIHQYTVGWL